MPHFHLVSAIEWLALTLFLILGVPAGAAIRAVPNDSGVRPPRRSWPPLLLLGFCLGISPPGGAAISNDLYEIGNPQLTDIWVDPVNGQDGNSGNTRATAVRTVSEAWQRIPQGAPLTIGYRVLLVAGTYPTASVPNYWESRYGSYERPIILQAADGVGTVQFPPMSVFDTRYLYVIGLNLSGAGDDVFHCERCDHLLLRQTRIAGLPPRSLQETVKFNQSQHVYIENSDISGGWNNALDMVAVHYGHVRNSRLHDSGDWCHYIKGGSAYLIVAGNEYYDCQTGGFSAGQGSGFEYMVAPWLHYEVYDIKFVNNVIHDTAGAGMGVQGGYNILMAHNTLYRIGTSSHLFEAVFGLRTCDGNISQCSSHLNAGGWGTVIPYTEGEPIPNRNVHIYNNLFYNPPGVQSQWVQFAIYGPRTPSGGTHIPTPAVTDANLQIRGNLIWNGPANHPLGIEEADQGCQPTNVTCNANQLRAENSINQIQPQLVNPAGGDFHPAPSSNVLSAPTYAIPDFTWLDAPITPAVPAGALANALSVDRDGQPRAVVSPPGAYQGGNGMASSARTAGLYNPAAGAFFLKNSNTPGAADVVFGFGPGNAGWIPLAGDWDGNGATTVGLYNPAAGAFFLKNSHSGGAADTAFFYGPPAAGWVPLAGDWDGNGATTVGLYNPAASAFFLKNSHSGGAADTAFFYGPPAAGWIPLAGDWNGDGTTTVGLYNPTTGTFYLKNSLSGGAADLVFSFGPGNAGWIPLAGDWNGDGVTTVGLYNPAASAFFLRNSHAGGPADITFFYGPPAAGWIPLAGDWNGP